MFGFARSATLPSLITGMALASGPADAAGIQRGPATRDASYVAMPIVLTPADRVRIETVKDSDRVPVILRAQFSGSLVDFNHTSLTVAVDGEQPVIVHRDLVARFEIGVDHGSRWKHAAYGTLIGGLFGASLGLAATSGDHSADAGVLAGIGAAVLGAVGLVIGTALPAGEDWNTVPIERVQWSPEPAAAPATRHGYE